MFYLNTLCKPFFIFMQNILQDPLQLCHQECLTANQTYISSLTRCCKNYQKFTTSILQKKIVINEKLVSYKSSFSLFIGKTYSLNKYIFKEMKQSYFLSYVPHIQMIRAKYGVTSLSKELRKVVKRASTSYFSLK